MTRPEYRDYAEDLTPAEIQVLVDDPAYEPVYPWLPGCARYADPVALNRRALVAFLSAPGGHPSRVARLVMDYAGKPDGISSVSARADFIAFLEDPERDGALLVDADPEDIDRLGGAEAYHRMNEDYLAKKQSSKAAALLAARGYNLFTVLTLAATLPGSPEQYADRLLAALDAGLAHKSETTTA